jgi:CHAD domain-containing protein
MELELALDPDDAARLPRLPLLAPLKAGTARTRSVRVVWHDSPDGELAGQGLVIAQRGRLWRRERVTPDTEAWPPGGPVPVLAEANSPAALTPASPEPLLPVAAFDGRARTFPLAGADGPMTLTLLQGHVRAVAGEHRACRVTLHGPDAAVLELASGLAGDVRLTVPRASLAAEALAVTRGTAPPPRREGAPELPAGLSVAAAFACVVTHLTDVILHLAPAAADGRDGPEPVHLMRVAVRRLRSAIKVFRRAVRCPAVDAADRGLKALAARLAPTRDWDVFVTETGAAVVEAFPDEKRLQRLLGTAERRRRAHHAELRAFLHGGDFRRLGIELACLAGGQAWQATLDATAQDELATTLHEYAARVLNRRLKRLAQADGDIIRLDPGALHAIRLRAKRLRYAAEIFAPLYPGKATSRFIRRLARLQERLGALNDATVAADLLRELSSNGGGQAFALGLVLGFVGAHGKRSRKRIDRAWQRFHRHSSFWD